MLREGMLSVFLVQGDDSGGYVRFNSNNMRKNNVRTRSKLLDSYQSSVTSKRVDEFLDLGSIKETVYLQDSTVSGAALVPKSPTRFEPSMMTVGVSEQMIMDTSGVTKNITAMDTSGVDKNVT